MKESFLINNRYLVSPGKNVLTDRTTTVESRLEQRLLQVLYLLAATPGELVSREKIIREVWNDYGGADEGLTQAVSFLRKVLNDTDKKIIETIPKKGYILNAGISGVHPGKYADTTAGISAQKKRNKWMYLAGFLLLVIITVGIYMFNAGKEKENYPSDVAPKVKGQGGKGADVYPDTTPVNNPDVLPDTLNNKR